MNADDLIVRCMAKQDGAVWVAHCIDFDLVSQADTLPEAKRKLHDQIVNYVDEAYTIDSAHALALLTRKAPLRYRLVFKFYYYGARLMTGLKRRGRSYFEPLPLKFRAA